MSKVDEIEKSDILPRGNAFSPVASHSEPEGKFALYYAFKISQGMMKREL